MQKSGCPSYKQSTKSTKVTYKDVSERRTAHSPCCRGSWPGRAPIAEILLLPAHGRSSTNSLFPSEFQSLNITFSLLASLDLTGRGTWFRHEMAETSPWPVCAMPLRERCCISCSGGIRYIACQKRIGFGSFQSHMKTLKHIFLRPRIEANRE